MEIREIRRRRSRSSDYAELDHFTLLFFRTQRNLQWEFTAIVLLLKVLVGDVLVVRIRRGLLKFPTPTCKWILLGLVAKASSLTNVC